MDTNRTPRSTRRRRPGGVWLAGTLVAGLLVSGTVPSSAGTADVTATASVETTPSDKTGDSVDDMAIWVDTADPTRSVVIGADHSAHTIDVYDLSGARLQHLDLGDANNVDVRTGFSLGGETISLVGAGGRGMSFYRLDPAGRRLSDIGARRWADVGSEAAFCLYRSAVSGRFYAFAVASDGDVTQYELFEQGGFVDARVVRRWPLGSAAGGCVADDETGRLFVSEARSGIWRYNAEPDATPVERRRIDRAGGGGHLAADVEGLALVQQPGRRGFLLASSEGDSTFSIYRRGGEQAWLGRREVADGSAADGCTDTDGIEAVAANLGPDFPAGIFVCQDGSNTTPGPAGNQNFKYVRLERIIDAASLPT